MTFMTSSKALLRRWRDNVQRQRSLRWYSLKSQKKRNFNCAKISSRNLKIIMIICHNYLSDWFNLRGLFTTKVWPILTEPKLSRAAPANSSIHSIPFPKLTLELGMIFLIVHCCPRLFYNLKNSAASQIQHSTVHEESFITSATILQIAKKKIRLENWGEKSSARTLTQNVVNWAEFSEELKPLKVT